jgi:hypothetical protein
MINKAWVQQIVSQGRDVHMASPINPDTLVNLANASGVTVVSGECDQFLRSGYTIASSWLVALH